MSRDVDVSRVGCTLSARKAGRGSDDVTGALRALRFHKKKKKRVRERLRAEDAWGYRRTQKEKNDIQQWRYKKDERLELLF